MLSATELWSQKETTQELATWGAARYFSVIGTTTELLNEAAVLNTPGTPRIGDSHPSNRDLRVVNKTSGPGLTERIVTARYQWLPNYDPKATNDDPLKKPPVISWGVTRRSEPRGYDIYGNQIANSAGDALSNPPQVDTLSLSLRVTRWERVYNPFLTRDFFDRLNSREMVAGGIRFAPKSILCTFVGPVEEYSADASRINMAYDFEIRPTSIELDRLVQSVGGNKPPVQSQPYDLPKRVREQPFKFWTVDTGVRSFATLSAGGVSQVPGDLYFNNSLGERVDQDVRLNGHGAPWDRTQYKVGSSNGLTPADRAGGIGPGVEVVTLEAQKVVLLGYEIYKSADLLTLAL